MNSTLKDLLLMILIAIIPLSLYVGYGAKKSIDNQLNEINCFIHNASNDIELQKRIEALETEYGSGNLNKDVMLIREELRDLGFNVTW